MTVSAASAAGLEFERARGDRRRGRDGAQPVEHRLGRRIRRGRRSRSQNTSRLRARAVAPVGVDQPDLSAAAFIAPAEVAVMPSISIASSSSRRSSAPQVKAPWAPPPCSARLTRLRPCRGRSSAVPRSSGAASGGAQGSGGDRAGQTPPGKLARARHLVSDRLAVQSYREPNPNGREALGRVPGQGAAREPKKDALRGGRQVVEAGFIQARNLSSSGTLIRNQCPIAKPKILLRARPAGGLRWPR